MKFRFSTAVAVGASTLALLFSTASANAQLVIGLNTTNQIFSFNAGTPGSTIGGLLSVSGLATGDNLVGIDFRPANDTLYALGNLGNIYTINFSTGAVTSTIALTPAPSDPFTGLSGTSFGVDFNPAADRLRVTTNNDQNLRINVANGQVITDGAINPAGNTIVASAYTNPDNDPGTGTTLYNIDTNGSLYIQNPPNNGTQGLVGATGLTINTDASFDIAGNGTAYLSNNNSLYTVNLANANVSLVGNFSSVGTVRGIAAQTMATPEPGSIALLGVGLVGIGGMVIRRRTKKK